jgi:hypothetical protein
MDDTQKKQIIDMRQAGASYAIIAERTGISKNTVSAFCRRNECAGRKAAPSGDSCKHCETPLRHIPGKRKKNFCSDKCRQAWWNAHRELIPSYIKQRTVSRRVS